MREYKFRARKLETVWIKKYTEYTEQPGEFVYGSLLDLGDANIYIVTPNEYKEDRVYDTAHKEANYIKVVRDSVAEFTGLKDKNGTEIYEGDIVREYGHEDMYMYRIVWNESCAAFQFVDIHNEETFLGDDINLEQCHVFGNIHQNPEVLS